MLQPIFLVNVKLRKTPLAFSFYVKSAAEAQAVVNQFEGNETIAVTTDPNATRIVCDDVDEALNFIKEDLLKEV